MNRRLLTARNFLPILTALSLLFTLATAILWIRSYFFGESLHVELPEIGIEICWIYSARGELWLGVIRQPTNQRSDSPRTGQRWYIRRTRPDAVQYSKTLVRFSANTGFGYSDDNPPGMKWQGIAFPYAVPQLAGLLFSALLLRRLLRPRIRRKKGLCLTCRYDLRHTPERCPECGTVVDQSDRVIDPTSAADG